MGIEVEWSSDSVALDGSITGVGAVDIFYLAGARLHLAALVARPPPYGTRTHRPDARPVCLRVVPAGLSVYVQSTLVGV